MGLFTSDYEAAAPINNFNATNPLDSLAFANTISNAQSGARRADLQARDTAQQQQALARALAARARGEGPSLAEMQLRQSTDEAAARTAGAIASQRGMNPALGARMALQAQAAGQQQMAGQAAQLRAQEQLQAQAALAQALQAQRGQDIGQMQANTGLMGSAGGLQVQSGLGTQGLNQQTAAQNQQMQMEAQKINAQIEMENTRNKTAAFGAGLNAIGGIAGAGATIIGGMADGGLVEGDHPANDIVPAMLSPHEIVLPRSITQADDAPERAAEFVRAIQQQEAAKRSPKGNTAPESYGRVLEIERELAELKRSMGGVQ